MSTAWQPWIERAATLWPQAQAYEDAEGSVDFANLRESSRRLARVLRRLGVRPGERVATLLPPSRLFIELFHAAQQARITLVPLNPRLQGPELARLLAHAAPRLAITEARRAAELRQLIESSGVGCEVIGWKPVTPAKETVARVESNSVTPAKAGVQGQMEGGNAGFPALDPGFRRDDARTETLSRSKSTVSKAGVQSQIEGGDASLPALDHPGFRDCRFPPSHTQFVMPAKAGIQSFIGFLDPRFRGGDVLFDFSDSLFPRDDKQTETRFQSKSTGSLEEVTGDDVRTLSQQPVSHRHEPADVPDASDVLTLVYTSGTTAQPKGVLLSSANYEAGALASCERLVCRPGDRWLAVMPMCHVGGLAILTRASLTGMTVVQQPRFDAASVDQALRDGDIAFVSLVPTMLSLLLDQSDARPYPTSLRAIVLGGGRLPPALVERSAARSLPLVATFGMTETAAQVTTSHPGDAVLHPGSAGHPLPGVDLCIDNPDTSGLGEILVRGEQVFRAYDKAADLTTLALANGWLHTGDLGRLDADGRLWVEVRRNDLIVSGGENVHPEEVEEVLKQHPSVADAGVFGIADEHWGQRVAATVVLHPEASIDAPKLQAWCRGKLAAFKVPREIHFSKSLPRTESGKLQRRLLQR